MTRRLLAYPLAALFLSAAAASAQDEDPVAVAAWEKAVRDVGQDQPKPQQPPPKPPPGQQSPVEPRGNLREEQEPAPRPGNVTLDPKYTGFIPVPGTPALFKFNAKPRVDLTMDNQNSGDENRFITARIPVSTDPTQGQGRQFNINAKGSQITFEVRAPEVEGAPRFYYQNDFYGSGPGEFPYRVRHLYGQIYNIIVGMTFSVFEDPDVWPDTVDYEGPNSAIFARRPLARFMLPLNERWQLNFGLEQPESEIDTSIDPTARGVNHSPDIGVNARWEEEKVGHVQLAGIFRNLGVNGPIAGSQRAFGWGANLSLVASTFGKDSLQGQLTYGEGIFRYCNDDFVNNDAAFDGNGNLKAIPYFGAMIGYTHHWNDEWRSTASYGYVHLTNLASQAPTAYHLTHYASLNVVYQIRKRLSLGLEGLYGSKEENDERRGNVVRVMFGLVYSLFD
jgi:hypothetical protein